MTEEFRSIEGFEYYEVSNFGRVKSLWFGKEKILKNCINAYGYYNVCLTNKTGFRTVKRVHSLVAIAFLNHKPCGWNLVINHKDFNRLNNNVDNLEIVTMRENGNLKHIKSSSQHTGVCWHKKANKWTSYIKIKGKNKHLGLFTNEIEAHQAYETALQNYLKK